MKVSKGIDLNKTLPWLLTVGGIIGVICSFIITEDKFKLAENPHFVPSCNLNPIIACGNVMSSSQGSVFGFPNSFIGIATFSVLITVGMALFSGARFKRWFWLGLQSGIMLGIVFAFWLLFESVYRIHALCPYCLTVDVVVITLFWYNSLYILDKKYITLKGKAARFTQYLRLHHLDILLLFFLIIIAVIVKHFWYYYGPELGL